MNQPRDLTDKTLIVGVTGCIGAYKALDVIRMLKQRGADVIVVMTEAATRFVTPLSFQTLSDHPVYVHLFDEPKRWNVEHIALAERADALLVIPATANMMAKAAHGIADDYLSTLCLAFPGPKLMAPAMNTHMWQNVATQRNLRILQEDGYVMVEPDEGRLASGAIGVGRLPHPEVLVEEVASLMHRGIGLSGRRVLVTTGPTYEYFDPVRFLGNPSSGKMGMAVAMASREQGAQVHLVCGPTHVRHPRGVMIYPVTSAQEMLDQCRALWEEVDVVFMAAAVSDVRPTETAGQKIKKDEGTLLGDVEATPDVLATLAQEKGSRFLVGFAAETDRARGEQEARNKLERKHLDLIALNWVGGKNQGFAVDHNEIVLLGPDTREVLPHAHKRMVARSLVSRVVHAIGGSGTHD